MPVARRLSGRRESAGPGRRDTERRCYGRTIAARTSSIWRNERRCVPVVDGEYRVPLWAVASNCRVLGCAALPHRRKYRSVRGAAIAQDGNNKFRAGFRLMLERWREEFSNAARRDRLHAPRHFGGENISADPTGTGRDDGDSGARAGQQTEDRKPRLAFGTTMVKAAAPDSRRHKQQMSRKTKIPNRVTMSGFNIRIAYRDSDKRLGRSVDYLPWTSVRRNPCPQRYVSRCDRNSGYRMVACRSW